ncbi:MAG TPA: NADH-quinone oxidoreductase subunit NuoN [Beijerinckiaceae bacterium]|nr:NADH-quinone oxidoreductase subunit NuoN [Beijerinckiaceae bacterium]
MPLTVAIVHTLPEIILAAGALVLILIGAFAGERASGLVTWIAALALALALLSTFGGGASRTVLWSGALVDDAFARFMQMLALIGALASLIMAQDYLARERIDQFEFPILILLSTTGMMILISANNLIALYLGFELMSLALYVIAAFRRDDMRASEAGLKYFVLGALTSGMLLYGASLLYGFAGTVSLAGIAAAVHGHASIGVIFGLVFLMAGLAFKMSLAPFHMWTPDVYEGAPTPVTAFFAVAPKTAAVAITVRVVLTAFPGAVTEWRQIIVFISILSMAIGSFAAIGQSNIKRLLAYSSIGHMGFAMVGLAAGTAQGASGVLMYMTIYIAMTLGTFAGVLRMRVGGRYVEKISDLSGLARTSPVMALFLAIMMFSLAGIPPLAGFFAKWYVFNAAIQAHLYGLAVIGVLTSAVACFYYIRIVKIMYFDEAAPGFDAAAPGVDLVFVLSSLAVLVFWIFPGPIVASAQAAARSLF